MSTHSVCEYCDITYRTDFVEPRMSTHCMACKIIDFGWKKMVLDLPQGKKCVHHPEFARVYRRDIPGSFFRIIQLAMHENSNCFVVRGSDFFKNIFHTMKHFDNVEISKTGFVHGVHRYGLFDTADFLIKPDSEFSVFLPDFLETCVKFLK